MRRIVAILLCLFICFGTSACKNKESAPKETAEQAAARQAFNDGLCILYANPNNLSFKQYVMDLKFNSLVEDAVIADFSELEGCKITQADTAELTAFGEYTLQSAVLTVEISTGERRVYQDVLITVNDGGAIKIVLQEKLDEATQKALIEKLDGCRKELADHLVSATDKFSKENKSFKDWYSKRKNSLSIKTTYYSLKNEILYPRTPSDQNGRELVWSEEFENVTALSQTKFTHDGFGSNDKAFKRTTDDSDMIFADGTVTMVSHPCNDGSGAIYQSPSDITTYGKMHFKYGYLELRAKVPYERGAWGSFWLQSSGPLQECEWMSEVDIFEIFASPTVVSSAMHKWDFGSDTHVSTSAGSYIHPSNEVACDWHTYGFEWTPEYMKFYVDDVCYSTKYISDEYDFDPGVYGMQGFHDYHFVLIGNGHFTPYNENYLKNGLAITKDDTKIINYTIDYLRLYQNKETDRVMIYE